MKWIFLFLILNTSIFFAQNDKAINDSLQSCIQKELESFKDEPDKHLLKRVKDSNIILDIYKYDNQSTIFLVMENNPSIARKEVIYIKDNKIRYASELVEDSYIACIANTLWECKYYFINGKLSFYESLGHGKSEDDSWDPEKELMKRYKTYLKIANLK